MAGEPLHVSVIIPVFNGETFLPDAVASVLAQEDPDLEIIIVDDGSTDRTEEIVRRFVGNIRYLRQANQGPAAARNRGLEVAQGNVIAFLDADDLWPHDKLKLQLGYLTDDPLMEMVTGYVQMLRLSESSPDGPAFEDSADSNLSVNLGASVFRKSAFDRVGLFDEGMRYSEDVDWFMRARESGIRMIVIEEVTLYYRLHNQNMTLQKNPVELNVLRALKKSLDRRRGNGGPAASLPRLLDSPVLESGFEITGHPESHD